MDSFILEDVNTLLKSKKGDPARLEQIKKLCESNEIISLSDRKYIERLTSQYLRKNESKETKKPEKPKFIPVEETPSSPQIDIEHEESNIQTIHPEKLEKPTTSVKSITKNLDFLSNKNIIYSIGAIVLAVILIAVVAVQYDGIELISSNPSSPNNPILPFTLESDDSSYEASDIISISGKIASPTSQTVRVSIENEQGKLIWAENLSLKNNGEFSTLALAGGNGWENSGEYTLSAEHEELTEKISFDFES